MHGIIIYIDTMGGLDLDGSTDKNLPYFVVENLGPDLLNMLRQSYDYLTIMPKLRSTDNGRLFYKTSYNERKAFHR